MIQDNISVGKLGRKVSEGNRENKTANYEFTTIVPVFNEQDNMSGPEEKLSDFVEKSLMKICMLFVNDCFLNKKLEGVVEMHKRDKHFSYFSFLKNTRLRSTLFQSSNDKLTNLQCNYQIVMSKYLLAV